jgi:hypothetical protein
MFYENYFYILLLLLIQGVSSITNQKSCKQCIFYIKPNFNDKYEIGNYFGKCTKFNNNDTLIGEFDFKFALMARINEYECGKEGKYYISGEPSNSCDFPSI